MARLRSIALWPLRRLVAPILRERDLRFSALIDAAMAPVGRHLETLHEKTDRVHRELERLHEQMDRILDLHIAPDVLRDFRAHNERLRAIQADCDLIRELNPMFNSFLRDLTRLQLECEELSRGSSRNGAEYHARPSRLLDSRRADV